MTESLEPDLEDVTHAELCDPPAPCIHGVAMSDWFRLAVFWAFVLLFLGWPLYVLFLRTPPDQRLTCENSAVRREAVVEIQRRNPLTQATWSGVQMGYTCQPQ